ncbi:Hypothetical predicted protein [Octopus vulgaris]|uniref:Uncharacterized protein n=1 Tax=Octopus vulgaris TaxID=6645 RepID=A0AA36FHG6_OCTVU|nr:Hypothetical predicted protein [Octopus vulgaris]
MNHSTAVDYNSCVRKICAEDLICHPIQVGGPGKIVEIKTVFSRHSDGKEGNVVAGKKKKKYKIKMKPAPKLCRRAGDLLSFHLKR